MEAILYLCNKKKCSVCYCGCKHTTDIKYAKNFSRFPSDANQFPQEDNLYIENEWEDDSK